MSQVLVGGVGDADLIESCGRVASGSGVQLDTTAVTRLQKEAVPKEKHQPEAAGGDPSLQAPSYLSSAQARAVVFAKLVTLVTGSTGAQPQLLSFLSDLLAHKLIPRLPAGETDGPTLEQLAAACQGKGSCSGAGSSSQQSLEQALQSQNINVGGISSAERVSLQRSGAATFGVSASSLFMYRRLSTLASAVGALSCEALQAAVSPSAWFKIFTG